MIADVIKYAFIPIITVMCLSGCDLQYRLLYYPGSSMPSPEELRAGNMRFWPSGPDGYRGFAGTTRIDKARGTVIVFHGNAGTAADRAYYVAALEPLGYRVLLAEYPGYGKRTGQPGELSFVRDAKETVLLVHQQYGGPLFLLGESLGCGVAAAVGKYPPAPIDGIVLITPWDTLLSVARSKFPWFPVKVFLKDKYDNAGNLKNYRGRIAVVGAEQDEIIPIKHAYALYESLPGDKAMWVIKEASHNDWLSRTDRSWWQAITGFVSGETRSPRKHG